MKFSGRAGEFLYLDTLDSSTCHHITEQIDSSLSVLWFEEDDNQLLIDGRLEIFDKGEIVFLTEFHKLTPKRIGRLRLLRFNRPFYCIKDHDSEVGCKGLLFFGASTLPRLRIPSDEVETFDTLWKMFLIEMDSTDKLQIDMLQMMLKRYLILCTRIYTSQNEGLNTLPDLDLVREFNYLVEQHFRTEMGVADYADMLNKSPKTLSNQFSKEGYPSPLQFIQQRRMLEARRLLRYSDKQIQEIGFEIGYGDVQAFSRFFKKEEGMSPREYREAEIA